MAPPRFLAGDRALHNLPAKLRHPVACEFDKQARLIFPIRILAQDDLAAGTIDLADSTRAIGFMPRLRKAERVHVEAKRPVDVGHEDYRAHVPSVGSPLFEGLVSHRLPPRLLNGLRSSDRLL